MNDANAPALEFTIASSTGKSIVFAVTIVEFFVCPSRVNCRVLHVVLYELVERGVVVFSMLCVRCSVFSDDWSKVGESHVGYNMQSGLTVGVEWYSICKT